MNKLSKNQRGFGAIEIVLVLIMLAAVGVSGYLVYKSHHKATNTLQTSTNNSSEQSASTSPSAASQATTVKISPLGIELVNVPGSISDLVYSISKSTTTPSYPVAGFSTTSLTNKDSACSDKGYGSIGNFTRITGTYDASQDQGPFKFVKQFNGFWIMFMDNGVPCSQDKAVLNLGDSQSTALSTLVANPANVQPLQ